MVNEETATDIATTVKCFRLSEFAKLPYRGTDMSAGYDLSSAYDYTIKAKGGLCLVKTDISISFPENCYGRLAVRSSLAIRGVDILGGVIDRDYTGNIIAILINHSDIDINIRRGERVVQIIFEQNICPVVVEEKEVFQMACDENKRGDRGFGSTGVM